MGPQHPGEMPNTGRPEKAPEYEGAWSSGQAGVNVTLLVLASLGSHCPSRAPPGDLRGGCLCFGRLSQGQWPPPGLQLSPHKASVDLASRRPDLSLAPEGSRARECMPVYACVCRSTGHGELPTRKPSGYHRSSLKMNDKTLGLCL